MVQLETSPASVATSAVNAVYWLAGATNGLLTGLLSIVLHVHVTKSQGAKSTDAGAKKEAVTAQKDGVIPTRKAPAAVENGGVKVSKVAPFDGVPQQRSEGVKAKDLDEHQEQPVAVRDGKAEEERQQDVSAALDQLVAPPPDAAHAAGNGTVQKELKDEPVPTPTPTPIATPPQPGYVQGNSTGGKGGARGDARSDVSAASVNSQASSGSRSRTGGQPRAPLAGSTTVPGSSRHKSGARKATVR